MANTNRAMIGIVGASGYSGIEATRILASHPHVDLRFLTSDRWEGETAGQRLGLAGAAGRLTYAPLKLSVELASGCAAVLLATPPEVSLDLAPRLLEVGVRVIDLSGAFRLDECADYPRHYGFAHGEPELLSQAVYGLPELFRSELPGARLVANPGCYPTASLLPLAPLFRAGLLETDSIIVDAASGVTGAGRKATEELSFGEVDEDFRAYKVLRHQHGPEIGQILSSCAGKEVEVTFTAHLLPVKRGILATAHARLKAGVSPEEPLRALTKAYADEPFVQLAKSPDEVSLKAVVGTNRTLIGVACEGRRLIAISAIDNLVKGAAGQAVQNLNLGLGWAETSGLDGLRGFYP
jgi:N-acetyl-gamma-glutamyl-phosphate reductase